jgi:hypothetical protein
MAEGEAWTFDNWRQHAVYNRSPADRIHLVIDTVGTSQFWDMVQAGWDPGTPDNEWSKSVRYQPFEPDTVAPSLDLERFNTATVRPPDEISNMLDELLDDLENFRQSSPLLFEKVVDEIERFKQDWRGYWVLYCDAKDAIPHYELLAKRLKTRLRPLLKNATFDSNEANAYEVAAGWIANTTNATSGASDRNTFPANGTEFAGSAASGLSLDEYVRDFNTPTFEQPVFIIAAPRSGSTMLFEALQKNKDLWTIGDESQREVESIPALHPANRGFESNQLSADDYTPQIGALLMDAFMSRLQNAAGSGYLQTPVEYRPSSVRFLEKTPKNALRIPFFRQPFPDAKFIFLHREAAPNIASMLDAWLSRKFVTYDDLPDWDGPSWSLLLPTGWRGMRGRPLSEIVAWQWAQTNERIMDDLSRIPRADWTHVRYESLLTRPGETLPALCRFAGIPYGPRMQALANEGFPLSRYTLTAPDDRKWKRHEDDIKSASRLYSSTEKRISGFLATTVGQ